jgi:hypothetical protein
MQLNPEHATKKIELLMQKHDEQGLSAREKDTLIALQQVRLDFLEEQFRLAKHKLFASQNEAHPGQGDLFNEVEEIAELEQAQADNEEVPHKRKRSVNAILSPSLSILSVK